ncbi:MAG: hypothetical protein ACK4PR_12945 [Gammaproteobacteria bacterium]
MKEEDKKSFFIVNEKIDVIKVKQELSALMPMVESMLQLVAEELNSVITCAARLWYIHAWLQHMQVTMQLYQQAYGEGTDVMQSPSVWIVNPTVDTKILRDTATSYIYQLQSLCHLAAYMVFTSHVNSHFQNSLIILDGYMEKVVRLIDLIVLDSFKPLTSK